MEIQRGLINAGARFCIILQIPRRIRRFIHQNGALFQEILNEGAPLSLQRERQTSSFYVEVPIVMLLPREGGGRSACARQWSGLPRGRALNNPSRVAHSLDSAKDDRTQNRDQFGI